MYYQPWRYLQAYRGFHFHMAIVRCLQTVSQKIIADQLIYVLIFNC